MKTKIVIILFSFVALVATFMLPDPRFMTDAYGQSIIDPDIPNPIIFAAQVPLQGGDFANRMSTFGNESPLDHDSPGGNGGSPRGGDLMIRYPDGSLRNLTQEAGYGIAGGTGSSNNQDNAGAIVVRDPSVHWDGNKALFSMIVSSATLNGYGGTQRAADRWQMYEVTGLRKGQKAIITKIPNQPTGYNNINPIYGSDDRIIYASDLPRGGDFPHLYPNNDEYEGTAVTSGLWSLKPTMAYNITSTNPNLLNPRILDHSPSGNYQPFVDSFGRVIFMRWDHMIRDQQADIPDNFLRCDSNTLWISGNKRLPLTFDTEDAASGRREVTRYDNHEIWPSRRERLNPKYSPPMSPTGPCYTGNYNSNNWSYDGVNFSAQPSALPNLTPTLGSGFDTDAAEYGPYGRVRVGTKNEFSLWQIWQDGTEGETLNHDGPHEVGNQYLPNSFLDDTSLDDSAKPGYRSNRISIAGAGGIFAPRESPSNPGTYYAGKAAEFATRTAGSILRINAPPTLNPRNMQWTYVTTPADGSGNIAGGRFRTPLPLKNGKIIASHTPTEARDAAASMTIFKLKKLVPGTNGYMAASSTNVTGVSAPTELTKVITEWSRAGDVTSLVSRTVTMWELEPAEVVSRVRPATPTTFDNPVQLINTVDSGGEAGNQKIKDTFANNGVTMAEMRAWLIKYNLALLVTFDNTSRDAADRQQPINLRVDGDGKTLADGTTPCTNPRQTLSDTYRPTNTGANASSPTGYGDTTRPIYLLDYLQIIQATSIRGTAGGNGLPELGGRRVLGQPVGMMTEPTGSPGAIFASVNRPISLIGATQIECDGSSAVFVPTRRALAWQSTDGVTTRGAPAAVPKLLEGSKTGAQDGTIANNNNGSSTYPASNNHYPLIRERVWVTAQPGEIRSCPGCHGSNDTNQGGIFTPTNYEPIALKKLLDYWKTYSGPSGAFPK